MNFVDEFRCFSDIGFEYKHQGVIDFFGGNCYFPEVVTTGITEINGQANIKIYPNPVSDKMTLEILEKSIEEVQIIDITGKEVLSLKLKYGSNIIDCNTLEPGMYFLKPTNATKALKFIKI